MARARKGVMARAWAAMAVIAAMLLACGVYAVIDYEDSARSKVLSGKMIDVRPRRPPAPRARIPAELGGGVLAARPGRERPGLIGGGPVGRSAPGTALVRPGADSPGLPSPLGSPPSSADPDLRFRSRPGISP